MKDKVLIVTTTPYMIRQFLMNDIELLQELGYKVDVATNFQSFNVIDEKLLLEFKNILNDKNITIHQINFPRSIFSIKELIHSYVNMKKLLIKNKYKLMHTHTPIASVIARFAAKNIPNMKVFYTAHGFHFFNGAPMQNWMIFYPIEKWLSKYTDVLITINKEDFNRAKKIFKMKKIEYVPGVGIDIKQFQLNNFDREIYREKLGLNKKDFFILSIGELNKNKNHKIILQSISKLKNPHIKYMIAGKGQLEEYLLNLSFNLGLKKQFQLLGFRKDIPELLCCCDIFVLPSIREGLNVSLMEALASGTKCIASNIRGNKDLINTNNGYLCDSEEEYVLAIKKVLLCNHSKYDCLLDKKFFKREINKKKLTLYQELKDKEN